MVRGNACSVGIALIFIYIIVQLHEIEGAVYKVGGESGWNFNMVDWPQGKHFKAGDVLVFNYDNMMHNVVAVDANGYKTCKPSANSKCYSSGNDRITLVKDDNYFLCSYLGHCDAGMKIAVHSA